MSSSSCGLNRLGSLGTLSTDPNHRCYLLRASLPFTLLVLLRLAGGNALDGLGQGE